MNQLSENYNFLKNWRKKRAKTDSFYKRVPRVVSSDKDPRKKCAHVPFLVFYLGLSFQYDPFFLRVSQFPISAFSLPLPYLFAPRFHPRF